ncbi:hypothetical protein M0D21_18090 [Aquimarina sp. D1M17]|uniref:hypothetical protein n=1 Tax=Aquimarina acroporae TaxID=2937283 RepID=UPI0020C13802|nr:hypothetical protein [Aquimarina acroporae]MCK8523499.1 hypothetical protein [Aquimarina acroporae]
MSKLQNLILLSLFSTITLSCYHKKEELIGEWNVTSLSEYPLYITNYDDAKLDKHSKLRITENGKLDFYLKDTLSESYYYELEKNDLILIYSDYGIPLKITKLNPNKLTLEASGFGNSKSERNRKIKIELKK